jgi:serine/threonine-protein kinase
MFDVLASGGMASVHYGRLVGARGFAPRVAIKKLLPMIANDPAFVAMFAEEARIASRIRHPNVVPTCSKVFTRRTRRRTTRASRSTSCIATYRRRT